MKKLFYTLLFSVASFTAFSQVQTVSNPSAAPKIKLPGLDKSPMDIAYYPANFPVLKIQDKISEPLVARVIYSRPQKESRVVFGELVEYNSVWRMGANEATEVEFFRDVRIDGKRLAKGRYTMYAIPTATQWTVIFNKDTDTWGAFKYDGKKDALRVVVPVTQLKEPVEAFTMNFSKADQGVELQIAWDAVMVNLPIALR